MPFTDLCARIEHSGLICMVVCLLVIPLSGCNEIAPMHKSEAVTITFAYLDINTEHFEAVVQKFAKRHPDITVNLRPETASGLVNLEPGEADVRVVWQQMIGNLQERGDIVELGPFIEMDGSFDLSDFYPAVLEAFTIQDATWAIPCGVNPTVMYYNQDLFDQYGVPYPENGWTWDDFLGAALAIRDPRAGVFGYVPLGGLYDPLLFVYQHGGQIFDDIQDPTRTTFDDPLTVEALEWYANLYHEHGVTPTLEQTRSMFGGTRGTAQRAILGNRVGMWSADFASQGGRSWAGREWPMRWGMVAVPRGAQSVAYFMTIGCAISSQSRYPRAAWQWVAFLSRQPSDRLLPVRESIVESIEYERRVGRDIAAIARDSLEGGLAFSLGIYTRFGPALQLFREAALMVEFGDWTPREAMEWAQREARIRIVVAPTPTLSP